MTQDWTSVLSAETLERLEGDPRPAWLWPGDGGKPAWQNAAAGLFGARIMPSGLKRAEAAVPVKGQIGRIVRLGLSGQTMHSRMMFTAGRRPLAARCAVTLLEGPNGAPWLLAVGSDPIDPALREAAGGPASEIVAEAEPLADSPLEAPSVERDDTAQPEVSEPTADEDGAPEGEVSEALDEADRTPEAEPEAIETGEEEDTAPADVFEPADNEDSAPEADGSEAVDEADHASEGEPEAIEAAVGPEEAEEGSGGEDVAEAESGLSALLDQLADHEPLFDPLSAEDDAPIVPPEGPTPVETPDTPADDEDIFARDASADQGSERAGLWQGGGRGFAPTTLSQDGTGPEDGEPGSPEAIERASRYNFEELSRILSDRVGSDATPSPAAGAPERRSAALVPLSEETLVLNRLPLGILIFRDQDILFANRALIDLTGHESVAALRESGLAGLFPNLDSRDPAGPVSHLLRRDGASVAVAARLNAVTWQGRPGFMLSARANDIEPLREAEIKTFASLWARMARQDFVTADRAGSIMSYDQAVTDGPAPVEGAPLGVLIAGSEQRTLRNFLSLPARHAGETRPAIALKGARPGQRLMLFAEGRSGIISGYFGVFDTSGAHTDAARGILPAATLGRITRGLRRPLNTISGFSELMAKEAFGPIGVARYLEYARDIQEAGTEIGDLADELDDYVRLTEGQTALSPDDIDIGTLLAECLVRVRGQASRQRVLLRSAISDRLPCVRADAPTLRQAVLNMLASAISEAREGSKVVLSAQADEDGAVFIHVRDAAKQPETLSERFVVFRDGIGPDGAQREPSRSSIGLTLTRSLVAVNACSLSLDPDIDSGTLMTLTVPASLVVRA